MTQIPIAININFDSLNQAYGFPKGFMVTLHELACCYCENAKINLLEVCHQK